MWFLQNIVHAEIRYHLPVGKDLIIGRKDGDIVIEKDTSVSRRHASLRVDGGTQDSNVELTDSKSKFGTYVNSKALSPLTKIVLHRGDQVKFGQSSITGAFRLVFEPVRVCCSGMASSERNRVKQLVRKLGGECVTGWSSNTSYLVMSNLTVTVKVVSALAHCRPIITPAWLEAAIKCYSAHKPWPNPAGFLPPVVDQNLGSPRDFSFAPSYDRKTLFAGSIFYFFCPKQQKELQMCVEATGGKCELLNTPGSSPLESLSHDTAIVLAPPLTDLPKSSMVWVSKVQRFLESRQMRCVQECELGFTLLRKSKDTYCNPRYLQDLGAAAVPLPPPSLSQTCDYTQSGPTSSQSQSQEEVLVDITGTQSRIPASGSGQSQPLPGMDGKTALDCVVSKGNGEANGSGSSVAPSITESKSELEQRLTESKIKCSSVLRSKDHGDKVALQAPSKPSLNKQDPPPGSVKEDRINVKKKEVVVLDSDQSPEVRLTGREESTGVMGGSSSVLAPSSLTPTTSSYLETNKKTSGAREDAVGGGGNSLPSRHLMASVFGGKRSKKRTLEPPHPHPEGEESKEEERPSKKRRQEEEVAPRCGGVARTADDVTVAGSGGGMEKGGGMGSSRDMYDGKKEVVGGASAQPRLELAGKTLNSHSNSDGDVMRKTEGGANSPRECLELGVDEMDADCSESSEVRLKPSVLDNRSVTPVDGRDAMVSMARTPVRPVDFSCGSFLSSRGSRTKKAREEAETSVAHHNSDGSQVSAVNSSQVSVVTGASFTALSLGLDKEILPQTALSTRGHRSKATPSRASSVADLMWTGEESTVGRSDGGDSEEGSDDEDPWERGRWESRRYEPVRDGSGFIKARAAPPLKTSKNTRLSFHARADFDLKASSCIPLLTQPVEVELVELVITRHQDSRNRVSTARPSGLNNFKRFRKRGSHRHQSPVDLETHVPIATNSLPDWELEVAPSSSELQRAEEGADSLEHSGGDNDGGVVMETQESQDFNVFSLGARKRRRR